MKQEEASDTGAGVAARQWRGGGCQWEFPQLADDDDKQNSSNSNSSGNKEKSRRAANSPAAKTITKAEAQAEAQAEAPHAATSLSIIVKCMQHITESCCKSAAQHRRQQRQLQQVGEGCGRFVCWRHRQPCARSIGSLFAAAESRFNCLTLLPHGHAYQPTAAAAAAPCSRVALPKNSARCKS